MKDFKSIDEYIARFDSDKRAILDKIRQTIKKAVPEAVEVISYKMPATKYKGKILVYFAAWEKHVALYPPVPKELEQEAAKYVGPKGNLKFPLSEPMPYELITRIVKARVVEIESK